MKAPSEQCFMGEPQVIVVDPRHVHEVWPLVEPLIIKAFESCQGDDSPEIVRQDLNRGKALLWVILGDKDILAAVTTKIVTTTTKKLCVVTACAGREMNRWIHFLGQVELYAASQDCDCVRVMGRKGWKRALPDYSESWVCLEKQLKG